MRGNGEGYPLDELLAGLEEARGRDGAADDDAAIVAVLWTWLESHLLALGSLEEKPPVIYRKAAEAVISEPYEGIDDSVIEWLKLSPLRNAAELLARIGLAFRDPELPVPLIRRAQGLRGAEVIVTHRQPVLVTALGNDTAPPTSVEHPSLHTLSPRLVVSPLEYNGIELRIEEPPAEEWELIFAELEAASNFDPPLSVHLDTLGDHGLSGWDPDPERMVGIFNPEEMQALDLELCKQATREAVDRARGPASILIMPELAAAPEVLTEIRSALGRQAGEEEGNSPLLTIVGAYHRVPEDAANIDPELLGGAKLSEYVNEAVAFGPMGGELWSQRKMSCAAGGARRKEDRLVEDIQLGSCLRLVDTPLGTMAIVICLDAFVPHVRERLLMSPAEILLIPSLSPSIKRHRESLLQLVHALWGVAFVCNRSPGGTDSSADGSLWDDDRNRSFWVPDHGCPCPSGAEGSHPSFVCHLKQPLASVDGILEDG